MAKRRRSTAQRSHVNQSPVRPGFTRRQMAPPSARRSNSTWLLVGALAIISVAVLGYWFLLGPGAPSASPSPSPSPSPRPTIDQSLLHPPSATPLASPPAEPSGDGTTATIDTELGDIVIELFTESAPVAAENFINLAEADFYDGVGFHRIIPDFMIQGGDPEGTGGGGPGYTIRDEPIVGDYTRATVAMARNSQPNSQGSQFFIVVDDSPHLGSGGYVIFGRVTSGMDVVDQIVSRPRTGPDNDLAVDPVLMEEVTIQRP